ncbi:MAG: DUF2249 domain-containing protein [Chloroflexi bacterium]|nr:DUF2249 domain-containing protein [Chloroflexota bacterium]
MAQVELDNRGLMPPEPMVRILSALATLGDDDDLVALMDREPMLLYPELERRGFVWTFAEAGDGYVLTIRKASP